MDVAIPPHTGGKDAIFSYQSSRLVRVGEAVMVPIATRAVIGIVVATREQSSREPDALDSGSGLESEAPSYRVLKALGPSIRGFGMPEMLVDLARFTANQYLCSLTSALAPAFPSIIQDRLVAVWALAEPEMNSKKKPKRNELVLESEDLRPLTTLQKEVLKAISDKGGELQDRPTAKLSANTRRALDLLVRKGILVKEWRFMPISDKKSPKLYRVSGDFERIESFLKTQAKAKPAQAVTLIQMQGTGARGGLTMSEIKALAGVTENTVQQLITANLLDPIEKDPHFAGKIPTPNPPQQVAISAISDAVTHRKASGFLLFGVTGSGKTEVYLRSIAEVLRQGRQALVLVPEIALASQMFLSLRERFGKAVALIHSELSVGERLNSFQGIRNGEISVVLGARSALFAPLSNLGLVIMDEEHESSYKQDQTPRYHARTLARFLALRHGCPYVFGSATPSLESWVAAENGDLELLSLPHRAAAAALPSVHVHDLTADYRSGKPDILSPPLSAALEKVLTAGEQAIFFINRRAYAPFILCRDCGHRPGCPRCTVSLSFHRYRKLLLCHHCGFKQVPTDQCPNCSSPRYSSLGVGTEKVEEWLASHFPTAKIARLDRDIAQKKGATEEILARFRGGDLNVLIGTQMVAKGLDFPNVTLVGVIAADISLNLPDFRAAERTFQLLSQVSGRAGRGAKPGMVFIQTFNAEHSAIQCVQKHHTVEFLERLKVERADAQYPPFKRLVNIVISSADRGPLVDVAEEIAEDLRQNPEFEILGPVDCVLEKLNERFRRHIVVKADPHAQLGSILECTHYRSRANMQITVDVDPYSLM